MLLEVGDTTLRVQGVELAAQLVAPISVGDENGGEVCYELADLHFDIEPRCHSAKVGKKRGTRKQSFINKSKKHLQNKSHLKKKAYFCGKNIDY